MSDIYLNIRAGTAGEIPSPGSFSIGFHRRITGYVPSPLRLSHSAADRLGVERVFVKDESNRFGLPSFKILGASYAVYRELQARAGFGDREWDTLEDLVQLSRDVLPRGFVTATDGNHGRGVARTAAWFGVEADIFVPEGTAAARIEGIESEGAAVSVVRGDYDAAVAEAASLAGEELWLIQDTAWPGYEAVPRAIVAGYSTIMSELEEQLAAAGARMPGAAAVQIGVGSLASAVTAYLRGRHGEERVLIAGVEPAGAACAFESARSGEPVCVPGPHRSVMAGLNCGTVSSVAWPVLMSGIDIFVTVTDEDAFEAMKILASDGIVSGESGSAGLAGMMALRRDGRVELPPDVLLISTEGVTDPVLYGKAVSPRGR
jgi:diaminopropionate ammonia-lyase